MNFMILAAESISWSDRLNYIGIGTLLGMGVVFAVLILLWLILELFHVCMSKATGNEKSETPAEAPAPVAQNALKDTVPAPAPVAATDDGELIAAITAAIAIYLEGEAAIEGKKSQFASGFRVVSFKKVGNAAHWNQN